MILCGISVRAGSASSSASAQWHRATPSSDDSGATKWTCSKALETLSEGHGRSWKGRYGEIRTFFCLMRACTTSSICNGTPPATSDTYSTS